MHQRLQLVNLGLKLRNGAHQCPVGDDGTATGTSREAVGRCSRCQRECRCRCSGGPGVVTAVSAMGGVPSKVVQVVTADLAPHVPQPPRHGLQYDPQDVHSGAGYLHAQYVDICGGGGSTLEHLDSNNHCEGASQLITTRRSGSANADSVLRRAGNNDWTLLTCTAVLKNMANT
jgi:hypothetical protein